MQPRGQVVKAMVLIRRPRDGALLVSEDANTVHREFQEEIGQALLAVQLAGVLENIFEWGGSRQHEIVFVFTAAFADEAAYKIGEQAILDARGSTRVIWRAAGAASPPLYPVGVADLAAYERGS